MRLSIGIVLIGLLAGASAGLIGGEGLGSGWKNGGNSNGDQQQGQEQDIFAGPPFPGTSWIGGSQGSSQSGPHGGKWIGGHGGKSLAGHRGSNGWQGSAGGINVENGGNEGIWHKKTGKGGFW